MGEDIKPAAEPANTFARVSKFAKASHASIALSIHRQRSSIAV
jgi:hypothetical protein